MSEAKVREWWPSTQRQAYRRKLQGCSAARKWVWPIHSRMKRLANDVGRGFPFNQILGNKRIRRTLRVGCIAQTVLSCEIQRGEFSRPNYATFVMRDAQLRLQARPKQRPDKSSWTASRATPGTIKTTRTVALIGSRNEAPTATRRYSSRPTRSTVLVFRGSDHRCMPTGPCR